MFVSLRVYPDRICKYYMSVHMMCWNGRHGTCVRHKCLCVVVRTARGLTLWGLGYCGPPTLSEWAAIQLQCSSRPRGSRDCRRKWHLNLGLECELKLESGRRQSWLRCRVRLSDGEVPTTSFKVFCILKYFVLLNSGQKTTNYSYLYNTHNLIVTVGFSNHQILT